MDDAVQRGPIDVIVYCSDGRKGFRNWFGEVTEEASCESSVVLD